MKKSTLLHLRIPFSFFLLPVFLFAAAIYGHFERGDFWLVFFVLHFLLYPASNGYNSYFDKDEGSIGGLKNPPKVSKDLYYVAWAMDFLAIGMGFVISWQFSLMLFLYGLVSKAYSHPAVRLKKMPFTGWLAAGVFQGYFTFLMVVLALGGGGFATLMDWRIQLAAVLSTLLLFGSYPMTQVYQHEEDSRRGDRTISLILGVRGTFHFTAAFFSFSVMCFLLYFISYYSLGTAVLFALALCPVLGYFVYWYLVVRRDVSRADFEHTMQLNFISSLCLNVFFTWLLLS